ncbi:unnamed protein product [Allacma fusca]|uniref:Mitochondrial fission 1 protein n=1 Tax=Allacma fusca TaxID=39272 RepID=A0A8J2JX73_9HEXA|nr:unnamed protein product [Allacma fusca]
MAADALTDYVSEEYLLEFEKNYNEEKANGGKVSDDTTFQYAWCLVRSRLNTDVRRGIGLLQGLLAASEKNRDTSSPRDYLYYLAVAHARLKDYEPALKSIRTLLRQEPGNRQAQELEKIIEKNRGSDAVKGAAIAGAGILVAGGLVGLGMALLKK